MIVCPRCGAELIPGKAFLRCPDNGYQAECRSGTWFFAPEADADSASYDPAGLAQLFACEERHFWFLARKQVIRELFARYVRRDERIIEVGAGTGNVAGMLQRAGYQVAVGELHTSGLDYAARYGIQERYQFDLMATPFREHFDVVCLFDVLEHLADDAGAVRQVYQMLRPGGRVIVTVPAHPELWNKSDVRAHHQRRYRAAELQALFASNGFQVLTVRGFFLSLLPLLGLRRLLQPSRERQAATATTAEDISLKIVPVVNSLLRAVLTIENRLLQSAAPRFGGSLALVAQRE